jgi:hypothetical protein
MTTSDQTCLAFVVKLTALSLSLLLPSFGHAEPLRSAIQLKVSVDENGPCGFSDEEVNSFVRDVVTKNGWQIVDDKKAEVFSFQASFIPLERPRGSCVVAVAVAIVRDVYLDKQTSTRTRAATVTATQFGIFNVPDKLIVAKAIRGAVAAATKEASDGKL